MKGIIVFKFANERSKSEGCFPYLYCGKGEFIKIRMINENPFENSLLLRYDGKAVELEGEYNDAGTFMVTSVTEVASIDLPAENDPEKANADIMTLLNSLKKDT